MQQPESINRSSSDYLRKRAEEQMLKAEAARDPLCRATWKAMADEFLKQAAAEDTRQERWKEYAMREQLEQEEIFELAAHAMERRYEVEYQNDLHHMIRAHYSPRVKKYVVAFAAKRYGKSANEVMADLIEKASLVGE